MEDEVKVLFHRPSIREEDPIIFVCNGEVNTNCLDDLHEDSCLKKGALLNYFLNEEQNQQSKNNASKLVKLVGSFFRNPNRKPSDDNRLSGNDTSTPTVTSTTAPNADDSIIVEDDDCFDFRTFYGFQFPVEVILTEQAELLFTMTHQWINFIAANAERHISSLSGGLLTPPESHELLLRRKQIKVFLNFVNQQVINNNTTDGHHRPLNDIFARRYNNILGDSVQEEKDTEDVVFLKNLLENFQSFLLDVGMMSDLPKHCVESGISRLGNNSINRRYHLFHLHLDIYWSVLELVFLVLNKYPKLDVGCISFIRRLQWSSSSLTCSKQDVDQIEQDFFQFLAELYVRDMIILAWQRFYSLTCNDFSKVSPFPCTCVKEIWIMLIKVLRYRQRTQGGRSFWFTLYQVLNDLFDDSLPKDLQENATEASQISFRFWITFSLAPLHQFNDVGEIVTPTKYFDDNYDEIFSLFKKFISDITVEQEVEFRYYLQGCLQLSRLWKPDLALVNILWNYFFRKLNSSFQVTTLTVAGLQTLRRTAGGLFEDCRNWQTLNPSRSTLSKDSSFHLFLRLVCSLLQETTKDGNHSSWRNFRGRLLSKFHQRGMQELTESGLTYFTELFLTLALCTRDDQLLDQLCGFYRMIDFIETDPKRQGVILRGMLAAMLVCAKLNKDIEFLAEKLIPLIGYVARKFVSLDTDAFKRQKMWELLAAYVEDLEELVERSQSLSLSEYKLITVYLSSILPVSRNYEMHRVLALFSTTMTKLLTLIKSQRAEEGDMYIPNDHHEQMAQTLWVNIFPFVEAHSKTQTALPEVADLAAQFLMLSIVFPDWSPASSAVLLKFTSDPSVNASIAVRFLGHILDDPLTKENILNTSNKSFNDSIQLKLIQCWIKCWILLGWMPAFQEQLHSVTRIILCFPNVARIFGRIDPDTDVSDSLIELFKRFGVVHDETTDWKAKIDLREEAKLYFSEISPCVQSVVKVSSNSDQLGYIYHIVGHLVKYCTPLLFNAPCLPEIIDSLLFPHSLFVPTKPLNPLIQLALQNSFHLFVSGLAKLNTKHFPYIQRRLRDLVLQYLPRFSLNPPPATQDISISLSLVRIHPLVNILTDPSLRGTVQDFSSFRNFVLFTIKDNLFKVENLRLSETSLLVFNFVERLIEKTTEADDLCMDAAILFQPLLEGFLLSKSPPIIQSTISSVGKLLKACSQHPDISPKQTLLEALCKFQQNYLPFFSEKIFSLCEKLARFYPLLLSENAVAFTKVFKEFERKSGTGANANLRQQWANFMQKLGKTEEELEKALE